MSYFQSTKHCYAVEIIHHKIYIRGMCKFITRHDTKDACEQGLLTGVLLARKDRQLYLLIIIEDTSQRQQR
jgi:hypothetical protein